MSRRRVVSQESREQCAVPGVFVERLASRGSPRRASARTTEFYLRVIWFYATTSAHAEQEVWEEVVREVKTAIVWRCVHTSAMLPRHECLYETRKRECGLARRVPFDAEWSRPAPQREQHTRRVYLSVRARQRARIEENRTERCKLA